MKKTFQLHVEGKNSDRLLDAIKHDIRKYVKRERNKGIPAEFDYITFACKLGNDADSAKDIHVGEIIKAVDVIAKTDQSSFYVEIITQYTKRSTSDDELDI